MHIYCLWSTLHHHFKQDLSKSVDKMYTVSMHVNVGWDMVYDDDDDDDDGGGDDDSDGKDDGRGDDKDDSVLEL